MSKKQPKAGNAETTKVNSKIVLGNGYTAYVEETDKGKRWVIRDGNQRSIPNAPVHKYIGDANNYYKKYLSGSPSTPQKPRNPILEADEETQKAHETIGEILKNQGGRERLRKALTDAAWAEANEHNLKNPDNPIDPRTIIQRWREDPTTIPAKAQGLIDGFTEKGEEPKLSDEDYNSLFWTLESDKNKYGLMDALSRAKAGREQPLSELKDRFYDNDSAEAELDFMKQGHPYDKIWNRLSEDDQQNAGPQDLQRMKTIEDINRYQGSSFPMGETLSGSMPQQPLDFNWNSQPTYDKAKGLWEEISPNYVYSSAKPYDQRLHRLATSGHGAGSSTIGDTEGAKQRAMHTEDLDNIRKIHNMLLNEHGAKGDTIGYLDRLATASRGAYQDPMVTEGKLLGDAYDRNFSQDYKEDIFAKDLAEGEMRIADQNLQDDATLYELLEKDRQNKMMQEQESNRLINQFDLLAQSNNIEAAKSSAEFEGLRQQLWAQREAVILAMRKQGMLEEAQQLQKSASDKEFIGQLVGLGVNAIGIIASAMTANPAPSMVASGLAEGIRRSQQPSKNYVGESAQTSAPVSSGGKADPYVDYLLGK